MIATVLFSFLLFQSFFNYEQHSGEYNIIGVIIYVGAMNQIVLFGLNKKSPWMILCIMLSVLESILVTVIFSISASNLYLCMIAMFTTIFFNFPAIAGFSADIYNRYPKNQATRLMGLILSAIGGIDLVIWLILQISLWRKRSLKNIFTLITILGPTKVIGLLTNQIIVKNVSDIRFLIFWIAITTLDCIFPFVNITVNYYPNDAFFANMMVAWSMIPKLFTAIPAVYIVIKGLWSNQEQTTIEMNTRDPEISYNML